MKKKEKMQWEQKDEMVKKYKNEKKKEWRQKKENM